MEREVELSALDLRYESCRMRNATHEARLLVSIAQRGIEEPLGGVDLREGIKDSLNKLLFCFPMHAASHQTSSDKKFYVNQRSPNLPIYRNQ